MRRLSKHRFSSCTGMWLAAILLAATLNGMLTQVVKAQTTITVNTIDDVVADDGQCSLREAITAANSDTASGASVGECAAGSGADVITLPAGVYLLMIAGADEDANATGDLDVLSPITINGESAANTIINGNGIDRVFHIPTGVAVNFNLNRVTVTGGNQPGGGLLLYQATAVINESVFTDNSGTGGSALRLQATGSLTILNSAISNNIDNNNNGAAAVVSAGNGVLNIVNTTLSGNSAPVPSIHGGGALLVSPFDSGSTTIRNSTFVNNSAATLAGGVSSYSAVVDIQNSIFHGNTPSSCGSASTGSFTGSNNLMDASSLCSGITVGTVTNLDATLSNSGGSTPIHALFAGSNALDSGAASCPDHTGSPLTTDQRGVTRPQGSACDIGAFELAHFTLTVALAGTGSGSVTLDPPGDTYASGTVVTATATADAGSAFSGWSGDCAGMGSCVLTMDGDKSVTATFSPNTYIITPTAGAGGAITPGTLQTVEHGDSATFTITPNTGYHIVDVVVDGVSQGTTGSYTFNNVTADHTIIATFASDAQPAAALAVSKQASVAEAIVGETLITYSYQVTNTGEVAITVQALDDRLGVIAWTPQTGGAAAPVVSLAPGQVALGTRTYTPQMSDLPAPLANTVLVTGTPAAGAVVTATASAAVDLLLRGQAQTMCYGDDMEALIAVQPAAMDAGPVDLMVISGPAPQGLLLRGVTACAPYTGLRSMVELTNGLVTEDCLDQSACNPVTRLLFGYTGAYTIVTIQEVQTVTDLFLPLLWQACSDDPFCL